MLNTFQSFYEELKEEQEKIPLEYPKVVKAANRTVGMMVIMFNDMDMNGTTPLKFCVDTSKFRKLQGLMELGDYGGKFKPSDLRDAITRIEDLVEKQGITGDLKSAFSAATGVDNAMDIIAALKQIVEVAEKVGVEIRAVNAKVI